MRRRLWAVGLTILSFFGGLSLARGDEQETPKIEPKADKCLKDMSNFLAGVKTYSFQVEELFDDVLEDGQKIELGNQRHLSVSRPDKLYGEGVGDTKNTKFYYDGKTATIVDAAQKTYATVKVPGTIDAMLEDLHERFDTHQTLADFLFSDPYKVFASNVESGTYLGLHYVGKTKCHHLLFHQKSLDWQIWIDSGEQPLPRKYLITFTEQRSQPQYLAIIHRWDMNPKLSQDLFAFHPPKGYHEVEFLVLHSEPKPITKTASE
jgi:hypothetical protein